MNQLLFLSTLLICFFAGCKKEEQRPSTPGPGWQTNDTPPTRPVANAGRDTTIQLPVNTLALNGQLSTGMPFQISWRALTRLGAGSIYNTNTLTPWVSLATPGTYQFELKLTNIGGTSVDTVAVTVLDFPFCVGSRPQLPAHLTLVAELSGPSWHNNMAVSGNKLFVVQQQYSPGSNYNSQLVKIFDLNTRSWTSVPLSESRSGQALIAVGDKVFFAGGAISMADPTTSIFTAAVDIYHASTNSWTRAQLSEPRAYCKATVLGNKVFFAGGMKSDFTMSKRVDVYDLNTNTWSFMSLPGPGRVIQAAVSTSNKIYFCGGYTAFEEPGGFGYYYLNPARTIDIYDPATGQWKLDSMQFARADFSAIAYNDKVYLAGGKYNDVPTHHVEVIDANTSIRTNQCLTEPAVYDMVGQTAATRNGQVIFFAGARFGASHVFDIYHPSSNTWSTGKLPDVIAGFDGYSSTIISTGSRTYVASNNKIYELTY